MPCYFPLKLLVISHFFYLLSNHFSMLSLNKNEERICGCSDASTICPRAQIYTPILPNSHTNTQSTTQAERAPNDIWRTYALATGPTIWVTDVCFKRHWNELAGNKKESEWEGRRGSLILRIATFGTVYYIILLTVYFIMKYCLLFIYLPKEPTFKIL